MSDDPREVRQQRRIARVKRRDQLALLARVMAEPAGREWFYDILSACHQFSTSFATNALSMAFREGERNVGLRLVGDLTEASPDLYLQMLKEVTNANRNNNDRDADLDGAASGATDC